MFSDALDFATTGSVITPQEYAERPDLLAMPMFAYGFVFSYVIPELVGLDPIIMTVNLTGDILFGRVPYWDDQRILDLNPNIAAHIPHEPIIVFYVASSQVITQAMNIYLSMELPEYAEVVGNSSLGTSYPIVQVAPERTLSVENQAEAVGLTSSVPYLFSNSPTFYVYTEPSMMAISFMSETGQVLVPTQDTIVNALSNAPDILASPTIYNAPGNNSWPVVAYNSIVVLSGL